MKLVIGNRNYSSWSLRAWLALRASGLEFDEVLVPLFTGDWREQIARFGPSGRVPILVDGDVTVWDSFAIIDYLQHKSAHALRWPAGGPARARAWSISAEMHSGLLAVRGELPQNLRRCEALAPAQLSQDCRKQIERIDELWSDTRAYFGADGPWLFGDFGIPDVMFAPVALRFVSYGIDVSPVARAYIETVQSHPAVKEWIAGAQAEPWRIEFIDDRTPVGDTPLVLG